MMKCRRLLVQRPRKWSLDRSGPAPAAPTPAPASQPADDDVTKQIYKSPPKNKGGYFK